MRCPLLSHDGHPPDLGTTRIPQVEPQRGVRPTGLRDPVCVWREHGPRASPKVETSHPRFGIVECVLPRTPRRAVVHHAIVQRECKNPRPGAKSADWRSQSVGRTRAGHVCAGRYDNRTRGADDRSLDVCDFFAAWEAGSADADVNADGGIDGADVEVFFYQWERGGC